MDAKLEHRVTHGRVIPEMTEFSRTKPGKNARLPDRIAEGFQPLIESGSPEKNGLLRMYPIGYIGSRPCVLGEPNLLFTRLRKLRSHWTVRLSEFSREPLWSDQKSTYSSLNRNATKILDAVIAIKEHRVHTPDGSTQPRNSRNHEDDLGLRGDADDT